MPPTSSPRPTLSAEPPLALLLATEGGALPHAARLERAGFAVRYCKTPAEARRLAASADLCDAALLEGDDFSQRGLLKLMLERCQGHKGEAARQLGLHRNTLRQKMTELGLEATAPRKRGKKR